MVLLHHLKFTYKYCRCSVSRRIDWHNNSWKQCSSRCRLFPSILSWVTVCISFDIFLNLNFVACFNVSFNFSIDQIF
uniref:Uncharacterized protein n=1 Tax=Rhizophora mucronata TaxID=61149 RepID=A0A2P2KPM9_RHIMU